jgi:hypothetical protein
MSAEAEKLQEITARALKIREAANELAELADELLAAIEAALGESRASADVATGSDDTVK